MSRKASKDSKKDSQVWPGLFFAFFGFSLIALPLIYSEKVMDSTLAPRLFAWTLMLLLTTLVLSTKALFRQLDFSVFKDPIFAAFLLFFLIGAASLLFTTNISAGFFDQVKTFSTLLFLAFSCLMLLNTPSWPHRMAKFFIVGTLVVLLIGYIQYLLELGFGFHHRYVMEKLTGLMSNINLYASYLMLMIPFVVFGIMVLEKRWRIAAIAALVLLLVMIFFLQTRAVYLAILVAIPAAMVLIMLHHRKFGIGRNIRNGMVLFMLGGGLAFAGIVYTASEDNIYVSRMRSIFTDTENPRISIWKATREMIADHPFTGVGAGNFAVKVQHYYGNYTFDPSHENWLRPHNDYLWVLSEKGLFGLMAFMTIFILSLYYVWVVIRNDTDRSNKVLALCLFTGLIAYMVIAFFDFPLERVNHQIVLSIYLASLITLYHQHKPGRKPLSISKNLFLLPLLALLLTGLKFGYEYINQEKHVIKAREANNSQRWDLMLDEAQRAKTPWKTLDALAVPVSFFEAFAYTKKGDGNRAMKAFTEAYRHNPHRKYIINNMGILHLQNGQYTKAISLFEETLYMYPNDIQTLNYLADAFVLTEQYQKALEMLERIPENKRTERIQVLYSHILEQLNKPTI